MDFGEALMAKHSITRSRAGHYTATITDDYGRRVFSRNLLPSLFRAQEVLREEVARRERERAALVDAIKAGTYDPTAELEGT